MTGFDITRKALDDSGKQITKIFEGLPVNLRDAKVTPQAMSPREIVQHLAECYTALKKHAAGQEHEWGTFQLGIADFDAAYAATMALRAEAVALAMTSEEAAKASLDYVVIHDAYHVGQMALLRLEQEPGWDPYSLYA
ncbi:MAG TPA: hypothetical protein PLH94_00635 [Fimbriimonadaceae bacterium]|nr:hypothetical protein [Fimbriimonadaceae bacterium]